MGFNEFFVSYGKFHNNIVNKLIHIVFIPTILFCVFGMSHYYPLTKNFMNFGYENIDIGLLMMIILPFVYIYIEPVSGLLSTFVYHSLYFVSLQMWKAHRDDTNFCLGLNHFWFMTALQGFAWIMQFIGHGVFEKRAPALLSNLLTVFVAPDFVVIEILYSLGYNKKAIEECQAIIDKDIAEYKKGGIKEKTK